MDDERIEARLRRLERNALWSRRLAVVALVLSAGVVTLASDGRIPTRRAITTSRIVVEGEGGSQVEITGRGLTVTERGGTLSVGASTGLSWLNAEGKATILVEPGLVEGARPQVVLSDGKDKVLFKAP